jgi:hypothetical protein
MQLFGAYVIFLLAFAALGLGLIVCGVVGTALYEGALCFRRNRVVASRPSAQNSKTPITA